MAGEGDELAQFATAQSAREAFHRAVSGSPLKAKHHHHPIDVEATILSPSATATTFDPADAPLPAFLELPPLPADPGLDGFVEAAAVEGGEGENGGGGGGGGDAAASMRFSTSGDAAVAAAATATSSEQLLLPLLLRAAMLPWEGASCESDPASDADAGANKEEEQQQQQQDLCSSLPLRLRHARWLASRVAAAAASPSSPSPASLSSDEFADALSAAIEANGRLLVDLEEAAKRAEAAREAEKGPGAGEGNSNSNAADGDDDGDSVRLLRSLAASLSRAQPRSSGWLRVRLVSYRAANRKQQQQQRRLGGGGRRKGYFSSSGLFACCSAPPPTLEDGEEGDVGERQGQGGGRRGRTLSGEGVPLGGGRGESDEQPRPPLAPPPPPAPIPRSRPLRRRPAAVALVWLRNGRSGSGSEGKVVGSSSPSGSNHPPPLPPPLLRTPPARRGATSVWEAEPAGKSSSSSSSPGGGAGGFGSGTTEVAEDDADENQDRFVPPTKVSTRFCTPVRGPFSSSNSSSPALVFRLRDALGRGRLAAAVAGGDPLIGSGELPLSEVLARAGGGKGRRAAGPVALGVPIFRESSLEEGEQLHPPFPSSPSYPRRRELAGVLRVVVDFVCEERLPLPGGDGSAPSSSSYSSSPPPSPPPPPQTFPAASAKTWTALLALLWRAWERERGEGGEKEEEEERVEEEENQVHPRQRRLEEETLNLPAPPPPETLASRSDLASGVGGLSPGFEPLERGVSRGLLPGRRFLAAARSAAALCRVPAPAQQAALLSLLLERWDPRGERNLKTSSFASSTAVAELAAALWRPLAAVARGEGKAAKSRSKGLEDEVAAAVSLAGGRAAAAAVGAVESFDLLWQQQQQQQQQQQGLAAARATLELCALGVTWSPRVGALADPLAAHVRRAARRMVRRAVVAAFEKSSPSAKRPSRASLALAAASAACDAARRGIELDSALAPAFRSSCSEEEQEAEGEGENLEGLDLVAVAGRVRVSAALALLRSALRGGRGGDGDDDEDYESAPPAYGAAAQRLEDAARALSAALERHARKRGSGGVDGDVRRTAGQHSSSTQQQLPARLDIDELFEPCISSALWGLRPLALAWVDRTLRPKATMK